jgi:hypothetical protein
MEVFPMRKVTMLAPAICLAFTTAAMAQNGTPSSKATADVNTLVRCTMSAVSTEGITLPASCVDLFSGDGIPVVGGTWVEIASKPVKLSNSQSLFVSPSLVSGLYTQTRTKTSTGSTSTAQAEGAVYMRAALIDSAGKQIVAEPLARCSASIFGCTQQSNYWGVVLDSRIQTLTQDITACTVLVDGVSGTCDFTSTIDFILQTASANTFNFIFPNVGQGVYTLKVYAGVGSGASIIAGSGTAVGAAAFGLGSVTAESVRLVHDFVF